MPYWLSKPFVDAVAYSVFFYWGGRAMRLPVPSCYGQQGHLALGHFVWATFQLPALLHTYFTYQMSLDMLLIVTVDSFLQASAIAVLVGRSLHRAVGRPTDPRLSLPVAATDTDKLRFD